jgi:RNA polymerase subunit RPABC4/transcription elongation factor Spt4
MPNTNNDDGKTARRCKKCGSWVVEDGDMCEACNKKHRSDGTEIVDLYPVGTHKQPEDYKLRTCTTCNRLHVSKWPTCKKCFSAIYTHGDEMLKTNMVGNGYVNYKHPTKLVVAVRRDREDDDDDYMAGLRNSDDPMAPKWLALMEELQRCEDDMAYEEAMADEREATDIYYDRAEERRKAEAWMYAWKDLCKNKNNNNDKNSNNGNNDKNDKNES